jgi:hypothetical protein
VGAKIATGESLQRKKTSQKNDQKIQKGNQVQNEKKRTKELWTEETV